MRAIHFWRPSRRAAAAVGMENRRPTARRLAALILAGIAALAVSTGCDAGGDEPDATGSPTSRAVPMSPVPSNTNHVVADVAFAQDMLANLYQGVQVARLAKERSSDPEIKRLAAKAEKDRETGTGFLPVWLDKYQQPAPPSTPPGGQGAGATPVGAEQLAALAAATGAEFDRLFLEAMIKIDEAAEILLNGEQFAGINGPLLSLSHDLQDKEKVEIEELRRLQRQ